ncbi:MAG: Ig-like domain-containing protein, partial [bacterium]|nr:Ig-like domain-containing protein [bacterium]
MTRPLGSELVPVPQESHTVGDGKRRLGRALCATVLFSSLYACGGGSAGLQASPRNPIGTYASNGLGAHHFTDANEQGRARYLQLESLYWGRLVDAYGLDSTGQRVLMHRNIVIAQTIESDGQNYEMEPNAVTGVYELTILRDVEDLAIQGGLEQFESLLRTTQQALNPVVPQGISGSTGGSAGLHTMIPRNAALVLVFNDLLDPATIDPTTIRTMTGVGLSTPFEARVFGDPNFGDLAEMDGLSGLEFYSTRVIVDSTISVVESFDLSPPIPVNTQGFPASQTTNLANVLVRIPTQTSQAMGQYGVLENLTAHGLDTSRSGAWDPSTITQDVVRTLRSGGATGVTGDAFNGFLLDHEAPKLIGSNPIEIAVDPIPDAEPGVFILPVVTFGSPVCAKNPERGDVISQIAQGIFADVLGSDGLNGADALNVRVRLRQYPAAWDLPGAAGPAEWIQTSLGGAEFQSVFAGAADYGRVGCFVHVSPLPSGFPASLTTEIDPSSSFSMRFSEPMHSASITAFDSVLLTREELNPGNDPPLSTGSFVVGQVSLALDLQSFTLHPELALNHEQGQTEDYFLNLLTGGLAATDLAGNAMQNPFPAVHFQLDANADSVRTGGRVSRFSAVDEEPEDPYGPIPDMGFMPEWSGQNLFDVEREDIFPRPVSRFVALADRTQPIPAMMTTITSGLQTPLSKLGSKMQTVYRFMDFGWSLEDAQTTNLDVSSISWSPVNGQVTFDAFSEFEVRMSHSKFAPDEKINPATLWPSWPMSGISNVFADNPLDPDTDPQKVVHARHKGYQVNPGAVYTIGGSPSSFIPYPLNQNLTNPGDETTYLWRNTALLNRAGPQSAGSPPEQQLTVLGLPTNQKTYRSNGIRSIGLPLLVEFRCYPDGAASGLNSFDISIAANSSSRPYLRAFSTGGTNTAGNDIVVHPDASPAASGGFNPSLGGAPTHGQDNTFYMGALEFVVRVSRSYSVWFPADDPSLPGGTLASAIFSPAVMEPRLEDQPQGTDIDVHYRGASLIDLHPLAAGNLLDAQGDPIVQMARVDASALDVYGDYYPPRVGAGPWPLHNAALSNSGI